MAQKFILLNRTEPDSCDVSPAPKHSRSKASDVTHSDKNHTVHRMLTEEDRKKFAKGKGSPNPKKKGFGWLLWLLLAIVLLLLLIFWWRSCHKEVVAPVVAPVAVAPAIPAGQVELVLPNGVKLIVPRNGMEVKMVNFLNSDAYKNGTDADMRNHWFEFEDVDFVRGSSNEYMNKTLSETRLGNVAAILKAFPTANIRIGGNADKTGTRAYNMEIAMARAEFIDKYLDTHGIDEHRITTRSFGEENAVFPATASAEEAATDRDIAFRFQKL